uniref:autophagy-related protein 13-like n=1 Tax=Myxine glutinosa TaxID=7769 RepID=UPI00358EEEF3
MDLTDTSREGLRIIGISNPNLPEVLANRKSGAFVSRPGTQTLPSLDPPFSSFLTNLPEQDDGDNMMNPPDSPDMESGSPRTPEDPYSTTSDDLQDDFIIVDMKPAFSKDDFLPMDLGTFYRGFQNPPQLTCFTTGSISQSMAAEFELLPEKLAAYEASMEEFDAFVETLQ